jgi:hypothetical protein
VATDLVGQQFNMLTVISPIRKDNGRREWLCECRCGSKTTATTGNLRAGSTQSCGCLRAATQGKTRLTHGEVSGGRASKEYRAWAHIVGRCTNPGDAGYHNYGGRGIRVSDEWKASFDRFLADMGRAPSPAHTVERINNAGDYSGENCRWATRAEQSRNTRRTVMVGGKCLKDACLDSGLSYTAVQARLRRGHDLEAALSSLIGPAYRAMIAARPKE